MKKIALALLVVLGIVSAAFAGAKPTKMKIVSGNSGGTYYYIGAGQSKLLTEKIPGLSVTTESTSGSPVENSTFCSKSPATMGIVTLDGLYAATKGDKTKGFRRGPIKNVSLLQAGHTLILYCVTLADSGIKSIADLKGKKISVPTIGNTAYYQAVAILEQYGITRKDLKQMNPMLYAEAGDALKDGTLDAIFVAGGIPQAAVMDLDTTKEIRFLSIEPERTESIMKAYPYWGLYTIPAGKPYRNMKEDTVVMTAIVTLAANNDLDEEQAYQITKTLSESVDELAVIHQDGRMWNAQWSTEVMDRGIVPFHPGAVRYYNELRGKK